MENLKSLYLVGSFQIETTKILAENFSSLTLIKDLSKDNLFVMERMILNEPEKTLVSIIISKKSLYNPENRSIEVKEWFYGVCVVNPKKYFQIKFI